MRPASISSLSLLVVVLALAGCGGDGAASADAGCEGETGCNGACELGNSWGVGRYCTPGGGECADTPDRLAPFCTADFDDTGFAFCTRPCTGDDQCGENARCASETEGGPSGCFPLICD